MELKTIRHLATTGFGVQFNETPVATLFKKYEEIGFIYPAKKALLQPYYETIVQNWKQMLQSEDLLLWVLTKYDPQKPQAFASISVWKQSNYGMLAQHLVSTGNPFLSLEVMLFAQYLGMRFSHEQEVRSGQNWFRPDNRYAYRIFASMYDKLGSEKAALHLYQYLHLPLSGPQANLSSNPYVLESVSACDAELTRFVTKHCGSVFLKAEELDGDDILLSNLGRQYARQQLTRFRKIYKIRDTRQGVAVACIIANRAPIGLNFSFLENRAYYIFNSALSPENRMLAIQAAQAEMRSVYQDFPLGCVPIVTDEACSESLQQLGATFQRTYMQSIWLREGARQWYEHIRSFLEKIESRAVAA